MRVVVVREYTDKYTGEGHVIGEKLDMTEERFAEIQDKGMFVVDISDEVVQHETASEQTEPVEHETSAPKQDKPAKGGRRNRSKKESEDK
jgi:hypothetical protein|nr:MAG TPA: hypothetical protein [Caudoviricetes sp.]